MSLKKIAVFSLCATLDVPPQTAVNKFYRSVRTHVHIYIYIYIHNVMRVCYISLMDCMPIFGFCYIYLAYITSKFQHIIICNN